MNDCEETCQNSSDNSWNCIDAEGCVELDNDSGEYSSLNDCEMACENNSENSWKCVETDGCFELDDDSGEFSSLSDCEAVCNIFVESYNCVDNACIDPMDGSGSYNDLSACEAECGVSVIEDLSNQSLFIYPNPTSGHFTVNYTDLIQEITIYNSIGIVVNHIKAIENNEIKIDISKLSSGIYTIAISTDKNYITQKVVKD